MRLPRACGSSFLAHTVLKDRKGKDQEVPPQTTLRADRHSPSLRQKIRRQFVLRIKVLPSDFCT
nr:MAG TPA: hypothetical protein [Caudoviricetes sp.]